MIARVRTWQCTHFLFNNQIH